MLSNVKRELGSYPLIWSVVEGSDVTFRCYMLRVKPQTRRPPSRVYWKVETAFFSPSTLELTHSAFRSALSRMLTSPGNWTCVWANVDDVDLSALAAQWLERPKDSSEERDNPPQTEPSSWTNRLPMFMRYFVRRMSGMSKQSHFPSRYYRSHHVSKTKSSLHPSPERTSTDHLGCCWRCRADGGWWWDQLAWRTYRWNFAGV